MAVYYPAIRYVDGSPSVVPCGLSLGRPAGFSCPWGSAHMRAVLEQIWCPEQVWFARSAGAQLIVVLPVKKRESFAPKLPQDT
jgi:hypothetical protein